MERHERVTSGSFEAPYLAGRMSPTLSLRGASKRYGTRLVLNDVALDLYPGRVHGLVGQNGSGKSTLIKILAGCHGAEPGAELMVRGEPVELPLAPTGPARLGVAVVHQDLGLVDTATVMENICIADLPTRFLGDIDWRTAKERAVAALGALGSDINPSLPVERLSSSVERALVALARALETLRGRENCVLLLDEVTAFLPYGSSPRLLKAIRSATRSASLSILFIGHDLEEVLQVSDEITVLRDGRSAGHALGSDTSYDELCAMVIGASPEEAADVDDRNPGGDVRLTVRGLRTSSIRDLSVEVLHGEIVGMTGLPGSGFEEVPYALMGASGRPDGVISLDDGPETDIANLNPRRSMALGLGFVPGDRMRQASVQQASATENATVLRLPQFADRLRNIRTSREVRYTRVMMDDFGVQPPAPQQGFSRFSGGNQQKMIMARWLGSGPKVLLLEEPTRGVDVGARRALLQRIRDAAAGGVSIMIFSGEYEELATICDRVLVFREGRQTAELRGARLHVAAIAEHCYASRDLLEAAFDPKATPVVTA